MKRKTLLITLIASISLCSVQASAVTYGDSKMSPSSTYDIRQNSPVVLKYDGYNNSPQVLMPQSYSQDYGPNSYGGSVPFTPQSITNAEVSPVTTNYGQSSGISYELNLGSIYGSAQERGNLVNCIKNMPLNKIGIGRTVEELTSLYTGNNENNNYWSYDYNSGDSIILRCGNYVITFKTYSASYGIDVYAKVNYAGSTTYLTEAEISNFFADLSNKLYEKEMKEKEEKEDQEKAQNNSVTYNNSVIVNGTNSGSVVYNSYK